MEDAELKKAGLKVTLPRLKILQILESQPEASQPMSAEDVYRALPAAGASAGPCRADRARAQFEAAGPVARREIGSAPSVGGVARGGHHDHMVCVDSGRVIEFHDPEIEARQRAIVDSHGYKMIGHSLVLYVKEKRPE